MQKIQDHFFSFCLLVLVLLAGSQVQAQVTSQMMSMSQGNHEALVLELPGAEEKMVEKLWTDFTKDNYKAKSKKDRKSKEYWALNSTIPGVSSGSKVDMYAKINERGNGTELMVWIGTNDGWINPSTLPDRYVEAEKMLMRFGLEVSKEQIRLEVVEQEKALKDLEKELENLRKDKEKHLQDIEKAKQEIADREGDIVDNEKSQEDKAKQIEEQRKLIEETRKKGDF